VEWRLVVTVSLCTVCVTVTWCTVLIWCVVCAKAGWLCSPAMAKSETPMNQDFIRLTPAGKIFLPALILKTPSQTTP